MSEMTKMGHSPKPKSRASGAMPPAEPRAPRTQQSDETFNLIARSLLNVSDQVPALVRDAADLRVDSAEIKAAISEMRDMIARLSQSLAALQAGLQHDLASIAQAVGTPLTLREQPRIKLASGQSRPPEGASLAEALASIPGIPNGERR
jgi:hypothetical protein